jgi:L-seryl-tRNA(Ser) seleniumtransferase
MLSAPVERLRERAMLLCGALSRAGRTTAVVQSEGSVGGGAFPTARIPSAAVALDGDPEALDARLRAAPLPVVGRIDGGRLLIDFRSIPEQDDERLATAIIDALT